MGLSSTSPRPSSRISRTEIAHQSARLNAYKAKRIRIHTAVKGRRTVFRACTRATAVLPLLGLRASRRRCLVPQAGVSATDAPRGLPYALHAPPVVLAA